MIRQRTKHDCGICTIAMAINATYEAVMETALRSNAFEDKVGMRREYVVLEAFGRRQMVDFRIMHRGSDAHGAILSAPFFRQFTWGRRAMMAVPSLNRPGGMHSVYWTGSKLFDPCLESVYTEWDQLKPDELILFNDDGKDV